MELVKRGGLQQVITTMKGHSQVLEVQRLALGTLYNTLLDGNEEEEEGRDAAHVDVGGMRAVALSSGLLEAAEAAIARFHQHQDIKVMAEQLLSMTKANDLTLPDDCEDEEAMDPPVVTPTHSCDLTQPLSPVAAF